MSDNLRLKGRLAAMLYLSLFLGIFLAFGNVFVYLINIRAGIIYSAFLAVYYAAAVFLIKRYREAAIVDLITFATQYGQLQKGLLRDMPLSTGVLDKKGFILWANTAFGETLSDGSYILNHKIQYFLPELSLSFEKGDDISEQEMKINGRIFNCQLKKISLNDTLKSSGIVEFSDQYEGYFIAIYLFDVTELKTALSEIDSQSLCICLLHIDNYEETLESLEEVRRSLLTALIDRKINKYINGTDGVIKKYEKDKYLIVLKKASLLLLQKDRFELLSDIKTVSIGNELTVTLSIGAGYGGHTYAQNYDYARAAIDLALGRGGDQAVVKSSESILYFGGSRQQMEKSTRVKARVKAHALKEIIMSREQIYVMGHKLCDVDSFGAAIGVYAIARALGRKANIVVNGVSASVKPLREFFLHNQEYEPDMFLTGAEATNHIGSDCALIIVDVNRTSLLDCPDLIHFCKSCVILDHHRQCDEEIPNATLSYVEPYVSSACEMVSEILQYVADDVRLKPHEADCIYAGIVIDTDNFTAKTGVRTFEAAAFLRRKGADVTRVRKMFRQKATEHILRAATVQKAEFFKGAYAMSVCDAQDAESATIIAAQAANELLKIVGVKASFVLTRLKGTVYVSARSIDEVNVQTLMEKFGGGGHLNMAGAQFDEMTVEGVVDKLKATIGQMIEKGELQA